MPLPPPPDQSTVVSQVEVTAARLPPSVGDAAFSIIRLNDAEITAQPRLDDVLSQVPGVSLFRRTSSAAENPTTQGISLRSIAGSGAGRALVTLDGVPQNDPFGGWVIWTALPPESLEGASVVRGAGAGPYGAGALTGVVALDELSRPGAIQGEVSAAQLGGVRAAAATVQPVGGADLFLSASGENNDGWIPVRQGRGAADDRVSLQDWSGAARLQAPIGRALMAVRVSAYREDRDAGLVGAQSTAQGEIASITIAAQPEKDALGWRLQGWAHASNLANTSVSVAAGRVSTTLANNQYATPALGWGFNGALRGQGDAFTWEVGTDVRGAAGEDQELFSQGLAKRRIAGGRTLVAGGYGEATLSTGDWLFTGGARIDGWATQDGHRVETVVATNAVTFSDHPADRSGALPSFRLGVRRDIGGGLYLRAAGYSSFRPPTLNELYRPFRVGNDVTEANPDLKPERLFGAEAALGGQVGGFTFSAGGFVNRLDDAVTNVTIGVGPGTFPGFEGAGFIPAGGHLRQRQNAGTIDAKGIEADASYALARRLTLRAAADYTDARVDGGSDAPQLTGLRPAQTPRFTATAGADWRPFDRLSLEGQMRYESSRFDDDQNTNLLAAAVTVDARVTWAFGGGISGYVAADNLFDEAVPTAISSGVVSYDEPRVFRVGLTIRR
ncbi:MAG: TonB-dependent receptor [Caulobacteraceae bacterium]